MGVACSWSSAPVSVQFGERKLDHFRVDCQIFKDNNTIQHSPVLKMLRD